MESWLFRGSDGVEWLFRNACVAMLEVDQTITEFDSVVLGVIEEAAV